MFRARKSAVGKLVSLPAGHVQRRGCHSRLTRRTAYLELVTRTIGLCGDCDLHFARRIGNTEWKLDPVGTWRRGYIVTASILPLIGQRITQRNQGRGRRCPDREYCRFTRINPLRLRLLRDLNVTQTDIHTRLDVEFTSLSIGDLDVKVVFSRNSS